MGSFSIWHWIIVALWILIIIVPVFKIVRRAGHSGWWSLLVLIPIVNLIALWVFAFKRWPSDR